MFATVGKHLMKSHMNCVLKSVKTSNRFLSIGTIRAINTSSDKKGHEGQHIPDGGIPSYVPGFMDPQPKGPQTAKEFADVESQKNWISYGWDIGNMKEDRFLNRWAFFLLVTVITVVMPFIVFHYPDHNLKDWSVREAYLQLDRRERLGLALVDRNLVDPNLLELPSDEQLEDTEIFL
ncbi:NADH dehydrogenase [ubiquinone] 1 beta subcomplex subunit 11, mitochondrial-like [Oppia nitens]|uniref:NADH dehydrogenase [ubiquinone] 1 beta subcomplex subunit 11, mitochondrial-like n=1 Tax=Oppia nitens TaxID=1686743 RepID=UPI0023DA00EF|nr:NADH dehydrogenase [ubiquinone] 1 beta subcomplex subunit 11, mitochondrial-like [Oppia nitens]